MTDKYIDKRRISGQRGVNLIEQIVLKMGWAWHPSNQALESGIDGIIEIRDPNTGRATNCILQVQSKATSGIFIRETPESFEYVCDERDLDYWMAGNAPVILVVSRPENDEAYWVSIKGYFSDKAVRKARRIRFNKTAQLFDEKCRDALKALGVPRDSGIYFQPLPKKETLFTNLLKVAHYPEELYYAATDLRTAEDFWERAKERHLTLPPEWNLTAKSILSFHNLREHPWNLFCDVGSVEAFGAEEWALSDDENRRREFVHLLNFCLRRRLWLAHVTHNEKLGCYYFTATRDLSPRTITYKSRSHTTQRDVFLGYSDKKDSSKVAYYRHSAFRGQFRLYQDTWYLEITPTYYFTADGKHEHRYREDLLKGIKEFEANGAVLGQVIMWAKYLSQSGSLFAPGYEFLKFASLETVLLDRGLDDKVWLKREEADEAAKRQQDMQTLELFQ